ncbi:MAG: LacI family transcriptional regulator [Caldilineae bacterium]|nr:MAG: LacI family transcriptional regulator [Caldilineae bacterium]
MQHGPRRPAKVTIHDVARVAGTSPSTVSRVLTGRANVRAQKREAVLRAIDELGYAPNLLARGLKTRLTYTLGLLINDIQSPFFSGAAKGAQDYAVRQGYGILLCDTGEELSLQKASLEMLRAKKVDGVIFVPTSGAEDLLPPLWEEEANLVQIDRQIEGLPISSVVVNDEEASYQAVSHLIANGYRDIAILAFEESVTTHNRRLQGYQRALDEAGISLSRTLVWRGKTSSEEGYRLTRDLLRCKPRPDALFATSSRLGVGALRAIRDAGLVIGRDIGVVVFDDIPAFSLLQPSISAIRQPAYEIGWKAAELLIRAIEAEEPLPPTQIVLPAELVIRESSAPRV